MVSERKVIALLAGLERMKLYCAAHPANPAAIRQPRLFKREQCWVAILRLGGNDSICGIGSSVETALRAFDENYLSALHSATARRKKNSPERFRDQPGQAE